MAWAHAPPGSARHEPPNDASKEHDGAAEALEGGGDSSGDLDCGQDSCEALPAGVLAGGQAGADGIAVDSANVYWTDYIGV